VSTVSDDYSLVMGMLHQGRENAVALETLASALEADPRTARAVIHRLRSEEGAAILTTTDAKGYYLPSETNGVAECLAFIKTQSNRARSCFISIRGARAYLKDHAPQLTIEDITEEQYR
jgi:hypothetical protein